MHIPLSGLAEEAALEAARAVSVSADEPCGMDCQLCERAGTLGSLVLHVPLVPPDNLVPLCEDAVPSTLSTLYSYYA